MTKTLEATFDGKVLRPDEPLELAPDTRVKITIETADEPEPEKVSFLQTARTLNLEGPLDWSERFEEYLYERENNDGE
ncbi:MAG: antitoxin family protein [Acidobacteria bacterium]|nr:antitoxin family protein [Acidobacteriota bacterium]